MKRSSQQRIDPRKRSILPSLSMTPKTRDILIRQDKPRYDASSDKPILRGNNPIADNQTTSQYDPRTVGQNLAESLRQKGGRLLAYYEVVGVKSRENGQDLEIFPAEGTYIPQGLRTVIVSRLINDFNTSRGKTKSIAFYLS